MCNNVTIIYFVNMWRAVVIFAALVAAACGQTTNVNQCTANSGPLPINAYIAGCDTPPCRLPQLENTVINIIFRAPRTIHKMTTKAVAYLLFIPVPYDLGENEVTCNFLDNSYCPVLEGEILVYTLYMYIESGFPVGVSPTVEFRIEDDDNNSIMCIRVPVTIAPPNSRDAANSTVSAVQYNP